ncbi:MAG: hypothetical protein IPG04_41705 [Polyangiaceae bacterium]|nr:hypothetical protein [Polyangiaceae bacterium]
MLEVVLGVRVVGADTPYLQDLALQHVDKLGHAMSQRTLPTVVDRRLLQELLIDASVGERVRKQTPGELLAAWARETPPWASSADIRHLLADALPLLHGDEGRLLAWAVAEPTVRMAELVIHGAVLSVEAENVPKPAWGPLWKASAEPPLELDRRLVRRAAVRLAEAALDALGDASSTLLVRADRVAREHLVPADLATSRVLPLAFADRGRALAKQGASGKPISAADLAWLAAHRAAGMHGADLAVLEAMGRLSRWLNEPKTSSLDVLDQVQAYQRSGAFADRALSQLRHALASSEHHHDEAAKVAAAARTRREADNQRFAETLAGGYEACLHRDGLTPLHRLWRRTIAPVWQAEPAAKLFLVVLDGCSYSVFLDLLHALSQDSAFPLGIRPDAEGRVAGLPAVAPLPTVTSHARGAIFLGELPKDPLVAETAFRDQEERRPTKHASRRTLRWAPARVASFSRVISPMAGRPCEARSPTRASASWRWSSTLSTIRSARRTQALRCACGPRTSEASGPLCSLP